MRWLLLSGGVALSACGNFETLDELTVGGARGFVSLGEVTPDASAEVLIVQSPELRGPIQANGQFELRGIPARAEPVDLYVRASNDRFGRVQALVSGGQLADVGQVPLTGGGGIALRLEDDDHNPLSATVTVVGSHLAPVAVNDGAVVGPVAEGCYVVRATAQPYGTLEQVGCTAGEAKFEFGDDAHAGEHP